MQKRKGFTLVELVIVIAVIAILAGVLIGTFASVLNKAQESARLQQIKADEHDQKAADLLKKIDDSNWYGWEDFETSIVEKITAAIDKAKADPGDPINVTLDSAAVSKAVNEAMTKYYAEHAMGNTSLTEEQVKAIIENAFGSFKFEAVTKAQVETIVNTAVGKMTTGLTAAQVQKIVNAAADRVEAGQLTSGQITAIVSNAVAEQKKGLATATGVEDAVKEVVKAIKDKNVSTLTAKEVEDIVNAAVKVGGTTSWVSADTYEAQDKFTLETADDVKGLATLVNGGYSFKGKEIQLQGTTQTIKVNGTDAQVENVIKLDGKNWTPIGNSYETKFEGTIVSADTTKPLVIDGLTLDEQFNAVLNGILINCSSTGNMDKVGVGFVAYLGEGATLENITFTNININITDSRMDGISVGVAVGYLDGGTIKNVTVDGGTVSSVYRVGGLIGASAYGTVEKCEVKDVELISTGLNGKWLKYGNSGNVWTAPSEYTGSLGESYNLVGGVFGYGRQFDKEKTTTLALRTTTLIDFKLTNVTMTTVCNNGTKKSTSSVGFNDSQSVTVISNTGTISGVLTENTVNY